MSLLFLLLMTGCIILESLMSVCFCTLKLADTVLLLST
jgi:hypothetical protein